ncbi:hypothetical protein I6I10_04555 [Corynebacterium glucuronolyticum]|uniref:Uncharacterized protein n=1 Tax=Corynebacterium glucuronolyticum TaxID=39791 RepID=A0A7T4EGY1_9CORY|nr:hypothetical protein [Corynebacterium glucuronolyticum]QQB47184.1 hypothetical protein I6I10_04555 [Corynebacterium glucuronolyticum]WKD64502.1 hypothetical protein CGLUCO_11415 [Corynebacterium glucuronolyticum DSM 44120]SMB82608.1 hypothetical protein SAMN05660745_00855 [Corynebacterium glucuronolyticum]
MQANRIDFLDAWLVIANNVIESFNGVMVSLLIVLWLTLDFLSATNLDPPATISLYLALVGLVVLVVFARSGQIADRFAPHKVAELSQYLSIASVGLFIAVGPEPMDVDTWGENLIGFDLGAVSAAKSAYFTIVSTGGYLIWAAFAWWGNSVGPTFMADYGYRIASSSLVVSSSWRRCPPSGCTGTWTGPARQNQRPSSRFLAVCHGAG